MHFTDLHNTTILANRIAALSKTDEGRPYYLALEHIRQAYQLKHEFITLVDCIYPIHDTNTSADFSDIC